MEYLLVLDVCLLRQSFKVLDWSIDCDARKQNDEKRRHPKEVTRFPKLCINMAIQSQAFSVHALIS